MKWPKKKTLFKIDVLNALQNNSLSNVFDYVKNKNDIIREEENETYYFYEYFHQKKHENVTSVNFVNCLQKLVNELKIFIYDEFNQLKNIYVFQIEHRVYPYQIPIIEFALYMKGYNFLNCVNIPLD